MGLLNTISLSQEAYIKRILQQFNMEQCRTATNPEITSDLLLPTDGTATTPLTPEQHSTYRSIIGALLYAANTTRLDIAHIVGVLSRFVSAPAEHHLKAARHTMRYLAGTLDYGLIFTKSNEPTPRIEIYTDASWGNDLADRKSTTGTVIKFNGNVISWLSKKQATVALFYQS